MRLELRLRLDARPPPWWAVLTAESLEKCRLIRVGCAFGFVAGTGSPVFKSFRVDSDLYQGDAVALNRADQQGHVLLPDSRIDDHGFAIFT